MTILAERTPLHVPELHLFEDDDLTYAVDGAAPNWIVVEATGRHLLEAITRDKGSITFGGLVAWYAAERQLEAGKAWVHVHDFLRVLDRTGMLSETSFVRAPYRGRAALVTPPGAARAVASSEQRLQPVMRALPRFVGGWEGAWPAA